VLDERLKRANSAVVMGTARIFLRYTENKDTFHQVLLRLRGDVGCCVTNKYIEPFITLVRTSPPEIAFGILKHVLLLVKKDPSIYYHSYVHFFCW
jgi:hypothetical protein